MRKSEAREAYGIAGMSTLSRWMERYGHGILSEHKELFQEMGTRKEKGSVKVKMP